MNLYYNNTLTPRIVEPITDIIPDCNISTKDSIANRGILCHVSPLIIKTHIYKYKELIKKEINEIGGNGLINLKVQATNDEDVIICIGDIVRLR